MCTHVGFFSISIITLLPTVEPVILVPPVDMNVTSFQDNIILTCNASGYPVPSISWTHNATTVSDTDDRTSIAEQFGVRSIMSTLTVMTAMTNDSGMYECIVTSPMGEFEQVNSGPVTVLVQGKGYSHHTYMAVLSGMFLANSCSCYV